MSNHNDHKELTKGGWQEQSGQHDTVLNENFVDDVLKEAKKRVLVKDILKMFVNGFWWIIMGFLKPSSKSHKEH